MKKFNVMDRNNGNLLITVACYDKKVYKLLMAQFKKVRGVNISEVKENE